MKSDVDIDLGIFDVAPAPKREDESTSGSVEKVVILDPAGVQAYKTKRDHGNHGVHAHAEVTGQEGPVVKIQVLNEGGNGLVLSNENHFRKAEHRPPSSWLRFMGRQLTKSGVEEHAQALAADIWWQRMTVLPERFEKGLFQDAMTRMPTDAEIARALRRAMPGSSISKSQWLKACVRGDHLEKSEGAGAPIEKPVLRSPKAKSFYNALQERSEAKPAPKATKSLAEDVSDESEEVPHTDTKKSLSTYDYSSYGKGTAPLKGDELEAYVAGFIEAAAQEQFRDMRMTYENNWWKTNRAPLLTSSGGNTTWGDVEQAREAVRKEPPPYAAELDGLARYVWQKLVSKIPDNKNLMAAKRQLGITQDAIKTRLKSIDFGC